MNVATDRLVRAIKLVQTPRMTVKTPYREITVRLIDGQYPAYQTVLPSDPEGRTLVACNPRYLMDAVKAVSGDRSGSGVVKVYMGRWDQPIFVTGESGYTEAIMPVRMPDLTFRHEQAPAVTATAAEQAPAVTATAAEPAAEAVPA